MYIEVELGHPFLPLFQVDTAGFPGLHESQVNETAITRYQDAINQGYGVMVYMVYGKNDML